MILKLIIIIILILKKNYFNHEVFLLYVDYSFIYLLILNCFLPWLLDLLEPGFEIQDIFVGLIAAKYVHIIRRSLINPLSVSWASSSW